MSHNVFFPRLGVLAALLVLTAGCIQPMPEVAASEASLRSWEIARIPTPGGVSGLAIDGDWLAIATQDTVVLFEQSDGAWLETQTLGGPARGVSLSQNTLAVASDNQGTRVFRNHGGTWQLETLLPASGSVVLKDDLLLVGLRLYEHVAAVWQEQTEFSSEFSSPPTDIYDGRVLIYDRLYARDGSGPWTESARLGDGSSEPVHAALGRDVAAVQNSLWAETPTTWNSIGTAVPEFHPYELSGALAAEGSRLVTGMHIADVRFPVPDVYARIQVFDVVDGEKVRTDEIRATQNVGRTRFEGIRNLGNRFVDVSGRTVVATEESGLRVRVFETPAFVHTSKRRYDPGEAVEVDFALLDGTGNEWVGIVPAGAPNPQYTAWVSTGQRIDGTVQFHDLPEGDYAARVFYQGYRIRGETEFSVGALPAPDPTLTTPVDAESGVPFEIGFRDAPERDGVFLALVPEGAADSEHIEPFDTTRVSAGTASFSGLVASGNYTAKLFGGPALDVLAERTFSVAQSRAHVELVGLHFLQQESIEVRYRNFPEPFSNTISVVPEEGGVAVATETATGASGTVTFSGLGVGRYLVRVRHGSGLRLRDSALFSVASEGSPTHTPTGLSSTPDPTRPIFVWDQVANAIAYDLYIADNAGIVDASEVAEDCDLAGRCTGTGQKRLWRSGRFWVRAVFSTRKGPWSQPGSYTLGSERPAGPITGLAADGSTGVPVFQWDEQPGVNHYEIWMRDADGTVFTASAPPSACSEGACSYAPLVNVAAGSLRFYVRWVASFQLGFPSSGPWGQGGTVVVAPSEPGDLWGLRAVVEDDTPRFEWVPVGRSSAYTLWVKDSRGFRYSTPVLSEAVCSDALCSFEPSTALASGPAAVYVSPGRLGLGPWSPATEFTVP